MQTTKHCYIQNIEALSLVVSEMFLVFAIVSLWRLSTPGAWPNLTPGAWLAQFEYYGQIHVCRPGAGADNPLGPKWFHKDKFSVHLPIPSKFSATTRFFPVFPNNSKA